ncbi:acyltransferase [Acidisphaera sp. S103]|uniref:acyltransferase family protein n=1 Tax=Acidisphaera sp. S103 TaxID=1747223 RepID=UPI00131E6F98|nr:acyltransferase [Acidisphaera sp. S103]
MATTGSVRLGWIEACRGVAATAVVIYHVVRHFNKNGGLSHLASMVQFGHAGVDLFFVISGFIILFVHFGDIGQPARIGRYVERRLTRILPAYWVAVALSAAMIVAGGHDLPLRDVIWAILPVPIFGEPIVDVAWTLQFEFVFYVLFAVLILHRRAGILAMLVWLTVIVVSAVRGPAFHMPGALYGLFSAEFFAGMAVAYRLRQGAMPGYRAALAAGIALFACFAVVEDLGWLNGYGSFARIAYGLASTLVILGAVEASRQSVVRVPSVLQVLGAASYSIYLFQFVFIGVAWQLWLAAGFETTVSPGIGCVVFILVTIGGGILTSRLVEHPLMNLIRNGIHGRGRRKMAGAVPAGPVA